MELPREIQEVAIDALRQSWFDNHSSMRIEEALSNKKIKKFFFSHLNKMSAIPPHNNGGNHKRLKLMVTPELHQKIRDYAVQISRFFQQFCCEYKCLSSRDPEGLNHVFNLVSNFSFPSLLGAFLLSSPVTIFYEDQCRRDFGDIIENMQLAGVSLSCRYLLEKAQLGNYRAAYLVTWILKKFFPFLPLPLNSECLKYHSVTLLQNTFLRFFELKINEISFWDFFSFFFNFVALKEGKHVYQFVFPPTEINRVISLFAQLFCRQFSYKKDDAFQHLLCQFYSHLSQDLKNILIAVFKKTQNSELVKVGEEFEKILHAPTIDEIIEPWNEVRKVFPAWTRYELKSMFGWDIPTFFVSENKTDTSNIQQWVLSQGSIFLFGNVVVGVLFLINQPYIVAFHFRTGEFLWKQRIFSEEDQASAAFRIQSVGDEIVLLKEGQKSIDFFDGVSGRKTRMVESSRALDRCLAFHAPSNGAVYHLIGNRLTIKTPTKIEFTLFQVPLGSFIPLGQLLGIKSFHQDLLTIINSYGRCQEIRCYDHLYFKNRLFILRNIEGDTEFFDTECIEYRVSDQGLSITMRQKLSGQDYAILGCCQNRFLVLLYRIDGMIVFMDLDKQDMKNQREVFACEKNLVVDQEDISVWYFQEKSNELYKITPDQTVMVRKMSKRIQLCVASSNYLYYSC